MQAAYQVYIGQMIFYQLSIKRWVKKVLLNIKGSIFQPTYQHNMC